MKRSILAMVVVSLAAAASAGETEVKESEVPRPVLDAVKKKYPAAKPVGFERETKGAKMVYEVKLTDGARKLEATFDASGKQVEEEEVITLGALPPPVKSAFDASKYAKWTVKKVEKVMELPASQPTYEVEVTSGSTRAEVVFDGAGKLVKEEKKSAKDQD
jgi:hypothetical protein